MPSDEQINEQTTPSEQAGKVVERINRSESQSTCVISKISRLRYRTHTHAQAHKRTSTNKHTHTRKKAITTGIKWNLRGRNFNYSIALQHVLDKIGRCENRFSSLAHRTINTHSFRFHLVHLCL